MGIPIKKPDEELIVKSGPVLAASEGSGSGDKPTHGLTGILNEVLELGPHASQHQDGGTDELNVGGLSGDLADPQDPKTHKDTHKSGGSDAFASNDLLEAHIKRILESGGQVLLVGPVADGEFVKRIGTGLQGASAGGAPTDAEYVVTAAHASLTAEKVLGTDIIMKGTLASRPAAAIAGRLYYVTDAGSERWTRDTGAAWEDVGPDWDYILGKPTLAPPAAEYLVGLAHADLSAERVVTDTPTAAWDLATAGQAKVNVPDNSISDTKLRDSAATSVIGRSAGTTGDPADIAAGADGRYLARAAGVLTFQDIPAADLPAHDHTKHTDRTRYVVVPAHLLVALAGGPTEVIHGNLGAWSCADGVTTDLGVGRTQAADWAGGVISLRVYWSTPTVSANARVNWGIQSFDQDGDVTTALSGAGAETITSSATTNRLNVTLLSGTVTPTSGANRLWRFFFRRVGGDALDTLNDIMRIYVLRLEYTADM